MLVVLRTVAAEPDLSSSPASASEIPALESATLQSPLQLDAETLENNRARINACYTQARGESAHEYWRAALDDQKLKLQVGGHEELGPVRSDFSVEQEWEQELQTRRAALALSVPVQGWEFGMNSQLDWQAVEHDPWQLQPTRMGGWMQTPRWRGFQARASWERQDQLETSKLSLSHGGRRLEAEVSQGPGLNSVTGRLAHPLGARGTLCLEAEERQTDYWQRRWLARYQWKLNSSTRFSAQGSHRWSEREGDWEDKIEALMELRF